MTDNLVDDQRLRPRILIGEAIHIGGILPIKGISQIDLLRVKLYRSGWNCRLNNILRKSG